MPILQLRKATAAPPPSRLSPERTALAEAITAYHEVEAVHAAVQRAADYDGPAATAEHAAHEALERAQAALGQARQDAASHLVNASLGTASAPALTVREARAAVQAAEDDVEAAVAARATIRGRLEPAAKAVESAQWRVDRCALAVVRAETDVASLLSELDALHRQVADKGRMLEWLIGHGGIPNHGPEATPGIIEISTRFWSIPGSWVIAARNEQSPSTMAWIAALDALKQDATTSLPPAAA
jgi:hypothetical protein